MEDMEAPMKTRKFTTTHETRRALADDIAARAFDNAGRQCRVQVRTAAYVEALHATIDSYADMLTSERDCANLGLAKPITAAEAKNIADIAKEGV